MRRFLLAALTILGLAAPAAGAQEMRFPPRKPLPYPQRITGAGPVLSSPLSARYLAYRYGYRPVRFLRQPVYLRVPRPLPYPVRVVAPGMVVRGVPIVVSTIVRPAPVVVGPIVRQPIGIAAGGVLIVRTPGATVVHRAIPSTGAPVPHHRRR